MENQKPASLFDSEETRSKVRFAPGYYYAHLAIILYIFTGLCIQAYHFLSDGSYRLLSIATWPWILTSSAWALLAAVILYFYALLTIARNIRAKLEEMDIYWFTMLPYAFYVLIWVAMLGRLLVHYISPEGIYFEGVL